MTLLCLVSRHAGLELAEDGSADVALQAASDFAVASAFGASAGGVGAGGGVVAHAAAHGDVEGAVELSVARESRWRVVLPEDAGRGATPPRAANAASERTRPRWE